MKQTSITRNQQDNGWIAQIRYVKPAAILRQQTFIDSDFGGTARAQVAAQAWLSNTRPPRQPKRTNARAVITPFLHHQATRTTTAPRRPEKYFRKSHKTGWAHINLLEDHVQDPNHKAYQVAYPGYRHKLFCHNQYESPWQALQAAIKHLARLQAAEEKLRQPE